MLIVISPAKTLDFESPALSNLYSDASFLKESKLLIKELRKLKVDNIADLMGISPKLAQLNFERFHEWNTPFTTANSKQALLAFKGDVYTGIDATTFSEEDFIRSQTDLRILSGLYGVLKPMDLIQAYRLEMGKKIKTGRGDNLYQFWGDTITKSINQSLKENDHKHLINLASNEYFKSINKKKIKAEIITPVFKDLKNGEYKMISFFAKKARGLMTRFIIQNKITDPEELKAFDLDGYMYNPMLSTENNPVFTRDH
ncbi:peroxide stress protein YaaA [Labilibaculum manganireducens]|uniref:peroxide stress protein YaaA n=1 Tax=Labilibaculum manganireducens TaxID=1940525 RepID=UPI0029F4F28B|nr:peroxide stress protein YaaA [Labilibaculum manganireducens]